jgi:hypothetical protein
MNVNIRSFVERRRLHPIHSSLIEKGRTHAD